MELRPNSMQETELAGVAAVSFILEHAMPDQMFILNPTLAIKGSKAIEFGVSAKSDQFEPQRQQFAAIRNSISLLRSLALLILLSAQASRSAAREMFVQRRVPFLGEPCVFTPF